MAKVVFFSFSETDRTEVLLLKGRAHNSNYPFLDFRVQDLLSRWETKDPAVIRQAISKSIKGTSRTIILVGNDTFGSYWVPEEVAMTIEAGKRAYAIRLGGTYGTTPQCLTDNGIHLNAWSEATLQRLANQ